MQKAYKNNVNYLGLNEYEFNYKVLIKHYFKKNKFRKLLLKDVKKYLIF